MAVGDTKVGIINGVLEDMGVRSILSLSHVNARTAKANRLWDQSRRECLAAWPWSFADARVQLTQIETAPAYGFKTYWQEPIGCIRPNDLYPTEEYLQAYDRNKWRREYDRVGGKSVIAASIPSGNSAFLRYTHDVEDPAVFTPDFVSTLKTLLKSRFAMGFRQDKGMAREAREEWRFQIEEMKGSDVYEGTPTGLHDSQETAPMIDLIAVRWG